MVERSICVGGGVVVWGRLGGGFASCEAFRHVSSFQHHLLLQKQNNLTCGCQFRGYKGEHGLFELRYFNNLAWITFLSHA